jgi:predicted phosphohydrolase
VAHLNLALSFSDLNKKEESLSILLNIPNISDDGTKDPLSHVTTQVEYYFFIVWTNKIVCGIGKRQDNTHMIKKIKYILTAKQFNPFIWIS